jgi:PiT family inorganic phosphate transporter
LVGLFPADFALDKSLGASHLGQTVAVVEHLDGLVREAELSSAREAPAEALGFSASTEVQVRADLAVLRETLAPRASVAEIPREERWGVRMLILRVDAALAGLEATGRLSRAEACAMRRDRRALRSLVDYAPGWVLALVASSLGVGTMLGWKRIVKTMYGKIGKRPLTYAQGASAEIVAAATIGASARLGLPLSTTHLVSSGIAGTMLAGKSGVQWSTIRNIALAWVLTLPVAMVLAAGLYLVFLEILRVAH